MIVGHFLVLLFALIETAVMFTVSSVVENATLQAARTIRTGQLQGSVDPAQAQNQYHTEVCNRIKVIADCTRLDVDVRTLQSFGSGLPNLPIKSDGEFDDNALEFDPGEAGDIILVRSYYRFQFYFPDFGQNPSNMKNNQYLITSTTAFKNEPFK